jgi:tripartite-type tricarboxylate transporter receptor subunit TctC
LFLPVAHSAQVTDGKLRAFAVTGDRAAALPKVPTMAEAGFRGFDEEFARSKTK